MEVKVTEKALLIDGAEHMERGPQDTMVWVRACAKVIAKLAPTLILAPRRWHRYLRVDGVEIRANRAGGQGRPRRTEATEALHVVVAQDVADGFRARAEANGTALREEVEAAFRATEKRSKRKGLN